MSEATSDHSTLFYKHLWSNFRCKSDWNDHYPRQRYPPMHPRSLSIRNGDGVGITTIVINTVCLGLATVAVGIRLWSRKIQRHSLVLNDYAAMLAWV